MGNPKLLYELFVIEKFPGRFFLNEMCCQVFRRLPQQISISKEFNKTKARSLSNPLADKLRHEASSSTK
jgi:hypothetical protein